MIGKIAVDDHRELFRTRLEDLLNPNHELAQSSKKIEWQYFEDLFKDFYSGKPSRRAMPIRLTAGCLLLKYLYNLSDERLPEYWVRDVYFQYFCGGIFFEHTFPRDPSDFVHFRKRTGEPGIEKIFSCSVKLHGPEVPAQAKFVLSGTTVQENSTTFPTGAKLCKKVIDKCNAIAEREQITQRQKYREESKQLLRDTYNGKHPKRAKQARKARKRLKTIANTQLRELKRKMSGEQKTTCGKELGLYQRAADQEKNDKNKVYSLHKPYTGCIAKGKAHKQHEFGNKAGLITGGGKGQEIILAIKGFTGNPYDGHAIEPLLHQMEDNGIELPEELACDRGGKGKSEINGVKIITPSTPEKTDTQHQKRQKRKKFRSRAGIEPVISHLKYDFRMLQNYLHGEAGIQINAVMAATAWNLKKWMGKIKNEILQLLLRLFFPNLFVHSAG